MKECFIPNHLVSFLCDMCSRFDAEAKSHTHTHTRALTKCSLIYDIQYLICVA